MLAFCKEFFYYYLLSAESIYEGDSQILHVTVPIQQEIPVACWATQTSAGQPIKGQTPAHNASSRKLRSYLEGKRAQRNDLILSILKPFLYVPCAGTVNPTGFSAALGSSFSVWLTSVEGSRKETFPHHWSAANRKGVSSINDLRKRLPSGQSSSSVWLSALQLSAREILIQAVALQIYSLNDTYRQPAG